MKILLILIVLLLSINTASASISDIDITKILPEAFAAGGSKFLELIGDQLYGMANIHNQSEAQASITKFMYQREDYLSSPGIQKQKNMNAFWFLALFVAYLLWGAARISTEKTQITKGFTATESYTNTYIRTIFIGLIFFLFYLYGLQWIIDLEWIITKGFIVSTPNIYPTDSINGIAYLAIAVANTILWLFFILRYIIVYCVIMYLLWLIFFSKIPYIGLLSLILISYGSFLFAFRIIIAFLFMAGATAIESLGLNGFILSYLALQIIIIFICYQCMILPALIVYSKIMRKT